MGGLVAAYMIAAEDEEWVKSHIASVVTFDSPLGGLPAGYIENWNHIIRNVVGAESACLNTLNSVQEMSENNDVVAKAKSAGLNVPFYTLDATKREIPKLIHRFIGSDGQFVPSSRTDIENRWLHVRINDTHSGIWGNDYPERKEQIVGCAVVILDRCNISDPP